MLRINLQRKFEALKSWGEERSAGTEALQGHSGRQLRLELDLGHVAISANSLYSESLVQYACAGAR